MLKEFKVFRQCGNTWSPFCQKLLEQKTVIQMWLIDMHENECTWLMVCWWWYEWIQYENLTYCVVPVTCSMTNLLLCKSLLSGCHLIYSLTICLLNKFVLPISSWYSSEPNSSMSRISLNLAWSWAFLSVLFCSLRCFLGLSNLLQMLNHDITFEVVLWKITN